MQALLRLSRGIDRFTELVGRFAYWLVLLMVIIGVWNVIGRFLGRAIGQNLTSNAFIEIQWYLFSVVFFLGAAYDVLHDEHVRVDVFYNGFNWRRKALVNLLGAIFFLIPFSLIVIWFSWPWVLSSWRGLEISNDPGGLPRYPIKSFVLIGFGMLVVQGISEIIKNVALLTGHLAPVEEQAV